MDIGASSVAASITNMVVGATKSLTLDMGVLLEGQTPATLPEQLLGTIRWGHGVGSAPVPGEPVGTRTSSSGLACRTRAECWRKVAGLFLHLTL